MFRVRAIHVIPLTAALIGSAFAWSRARGDVRAPFDRDTLAARFAADRTPTVPANS